MPIVAMRVRTLNRSGFSFVIFPVITRKTPFKAVAEHLGTEHHEIYVSAADTLSVIERLPKLYDEPFADSSQIPTFLVAAMARRTVTVVLAGDGSDEIFCGYNRYIWGEQLWNRLRNFPSWTRRIAASAVLRSPPESWERFYCSWAAFLPKRFQLRQPGDKLHKLAKVAAAHSAEDFYLGLASQWNRPELAVVNGREPLSTIFDQSSPSAFNNFIEYMMYIDAISYLPDDILVKTDRATMGVSLEARNPYLDARVVEFASRLPLEYNVREGQGKWLLRQVLYRHVPRSLIERPKSGFALPLDSWLRGELRAWAEALLESRRLKDEGYFNSDAVRSLWSEHLSGNMNHAHALWSILIFQSSS